MARPTRAPGAPSARSRSPTVVDARRARRRRAAAPPPARRRAAPRARARAPRRTPSRPARSSRRARSGRSACCEELVVGGDRVDPGAALARAPARRSAPSEETSSLCCEQGAHRRRRDLHARVARRLLGAQAELDLVGERDGERVALDRRRVGARGRLDRGEAAAVRVGARARTRSRGRRVAGALRVQPARAGEAPGAVDEHADADPLGLDVGDVLDPAVLRRHLLTAHDDRARVRVLGPRREGGVDRFRRCRARGRTLTGATLSPPRWWRNW